MQSARTNESIENCRKEIRKLHNLSKTLDKWEKNQIGSRYLNSVKTYSKNIYQWSQVTIYILGYLDNGFH